MRTSLFYNPFDLVERLAIASRRQRRLRRLRHTPAAGLKSGHIDSLELLELLAVQPPKVIYDIGANRGTWTCLAKAVFPDAGVEAFEPLATHFAGFQTGTKALAGVRLHRVALGATAATLEMEVMDFSDASSFLPATAATRAEFAIQAVRRESVDVVPLDQFRLQQALPAPDLIKLDVQGFELEVLRGAEETLQSTRAVLAEVNFREYYRGQPLFHEVVAFLGARGFLLHALAESTPLGTPLGQTDALFLKHSPA